MLLIRNLIFFFYGFGLLVKWKFFVGFFFMNFIFVVLCLLIMRDFCVIMIDFEGKYKVVFFGIIKELFVRIMMLFCIL